MAIWEDNARRYEARLQAFGFITVNMHRYLNAKDNGFPVVPICYPHWGDIPREAVDNLCEEDLDRLSESIHILFVRAKVSGKHSITIDDLLTELNWAFNPADIQGLKMVYNTPKDPKQLKITKRKRIGVIT